MGPLYYIASECILNSLRSGECVAKQRLESNIVLDKKTLENIQKKIEKYGINVEEILTEYEEIADSHEWDYLCSLIGKLRKYPALDKLLSDGEYLRQTHIDALMKLDNSTAENVLIKAICSEIAYHPYYDFYKKYKRYYNAVNDARFARKIKETLESLEEIRRLHPHLVREQKAENNRWNPFKRKRF